MNEEVQSLKTGTIYSDIDSSKQSVIVILYSFSSFRAMDLTDPVEWLETGIGGI